MKRNIVSLIIATTIITGVMPTTANAETVNRINKPDYSQIFQ